MPGVDEKKSRHAVDFGAFFSCADGTTPQELLHAGIYSQIAIALKGSHWRRASLVVIARSISGMGDAAVQEELHRHRHWTTTPHAKHLLRRAPSLSVMMARASGKPALATVTKAASTSSSPARISAGTSTSTGFELAGGKRTGVGWKLARKLGVPFSDEEVKRVAHDGCS